jgi:hypothetical protein
MFESLVAAVAGEIIVAAIIGIVVAQLGPKSPTA